MAEEDILKIYFKELCVLAYLVGYKQGYEEAYHQTVQKPIRNLIKLSILTDEQIASAMNVTLDYIAEIRETVTFEE
ncbi:hypothetical protein [Dyadobacter sp.]|uniref:hypothetical protein n=1 Tax=Dyadobacter sp. TaxID=1914288 RepID=UPI003F6FB86F